MEKTEERKIKVAQIIGAAGAGGVETVILNYYKHIDRSKVQFDILAESESAIVRRDFIESLGGHLVIIPSYKNPAKYVDVLTKIFKDGHYDIVHSNMNTLSCFALKAAKKAGVNVRIAHSHSTSSPKEFARNTIKNILRPFSKKYATAYFACSEKAGRYLFGDRAFDSGKVVIVNNAIDLERFKFSLKDREAIRKELRIENKFVVGHVGRMVTVKNQSFLLDSFFEIAVKNDDAVLLILGDGPLRKDLESKAQDLGILDKVLFLGIHADAEKYYSSMDCMILPSLYEGLPVTVMEAQAEGLPCFVSDAVTKECSITNLVHWISLSQTPAQWADEILKYTPSNANRESYHVTLESSRYNIKKEADRLVEIYQQLLAKELV